MARDRGLAGLEHELVGERAAALGRVARAMEQALAALRALDGDDAATTPIATEATRRRELRADLVAIAGEKVWFYVIQREALGWYEHEAALAAYQVPAEVIARMGPRLRRA